MKRGDLSMRPWLAASPAVSDHLITATWQKHGRGSPSRRDKHAYLGKQFVLVSLMQYLFFFLKCFWGNRCIWQSESLCVTYSVQFKVPLFLLSAGVGSHRGAVQPLHCRGSNCRGRQRERVWIFKPRVSDGPRVRRKTFLHLVTTPNNCHKIRCPQQYERSQANLAASPSEVKAMDHALKGSCNFEWITSATRFVVLWTSQTGEHREKRQRNCFTGNTLLEENTG